MLSAVVLTKNEERHIVDCLESLSFCDEIIVIDDYSDDRTIEIIKGSFKTKNIKIFKRKLNFDFATQRNFGLQKVSHEWALFIDVDERVSSFLQNEIMQAIKNPLNNHKAYAIRRIDVVWGKKLLYGETGNVRFIRLAKKDAGRWLGKVHEIWRIDGSVGQFDNPIMHYPHPTIAEFLQEINFYTSLRAQELFERGGKAYWWSIILYPKAKFFLNYILKMGFLDGLPGLIFALLMSFHSFLVRGKLWFLWQKEERRLF